MCGTLNTHPSCLIHQLYWCTTLQGPSQSHAKASQPTGSAVPKHSVKTPAASKPVNVLPSSKSTPAKKQQQQHRTETKATQSLDPFAKPVQRKTQADPLTKASARKPQAKINNVRQEDAPVELNGKSSKASSTYTSGAQEVDRGSSSQAENRNVVQRPQVENARSSVVEENLVKLTMRLMGGKSDA